MFSFLETIPRCKDTKENQRKDFTYCNQQCQCEKNLSNGLRYTRKIAFTVNDAATAAIAARPPLFPVTTAESLSETIKRVYNLMKPKQLCGCCCCCCCCCCVTLFVVGGESIFVHPVDRNYSQHSRRGSSSFLQTGS